MKINIEKTCKILFYDQGHSQVPKAFVKFQKFFEHVLNLLNFEQSSSIAIFSSIIIIFWRKEMFLIDKLEFKNNRYL